MTRDLENDMHVPLEGVGKARELDIWTGRDNKAEEVMDKSLRTFWTAKETFDKVKRQLIDWEKSLRSMKLKKK